MQNFRNLDVWAVAHRLTLDSYRQTRRFPREEVYGLAAQIRRASASIGANIAEGCGKSGDAELARFLQIAMGSASELEYHFLLAFDLEYVNADDYKHLNDETLRVKKMLSSLINKLRSKEVAAACN